MVTFLHYYKFISVLSLASVRAYLVYYQILSVLSVESVRAKYEV